MDYVKHIKEDDSPLFSLMFDEYFTPTQISNIISSSMSSIGVQNTSGHSLRISAATELASKGVSQSVIETAGNWVPNSKARLRYQRRIGLATHGLTTSIMRTD
ncbi:predicted protein [Naegleria gruberi]|uniref:Predicted protein n=1 Tax=Naegleria gruberi TaxID=5762 RepID=D2W631_NAEGR|nr:uncharacterized protein NAEGRDRAFT_76874 [Naegleria gruberi]EFC35471.1 predicted protein [Naegleria gruberi]|eukprot:XP_002668215.1 predicted protein [Naegleria gruberi strain NEG-M]